MGRRKRERERKLRRSKMSGSRTKCKENSFVAFERVRNIEEREDISIKSAIKIRAKSQLKGRLQKSRKFVVRDRERERVGRGSEGGDVPFDVSKGKEKAPSPTR